MTESGRQNSSPRGGPAQPRQGGPRASPSKQSAQSQSDQPRPDQPRPDQPRPDQPRSDQPPRDTRPRATGRAAILAIFFCAVVLSLAYPVREYVAQRRQIDELEAQRAQIAKQLSRLETERRRLSEPSYIEQLARDRLHMCLPNQMCYVVIGPPARNRTSAAPKHTTEPWYAKLWSSVQLADGRPSPRPHSATWRPAGRHVAASRPAIRHAAAVS